MEAPPVPAYSRCASRDVRAEARAVPAAFLVREREASVVKLKWFGLAHGKLDARNSPPGSLTRAPSQESNALGARRPSRVSEISRARKKRDVSATILAIREPSDTSETVLRIGHGAGRGLPLFRAARRGKIASQWFREKSPGRPCRSIRHGHAAAAFGTAGDSRTRTAPFQRQRSSGRACGS